MKNPFKLKYPKIISLGLVIIFAYILFSNLFIASYISKLHEFQYLSVFLFGMLFAFGFTAPFSVGYFLTYSSPNVLLAGIIAGIGAMISDLLIFKFIKFSFKDEFEMLKKEKATLSINQAMRKFLGERLRKGLLYVFAGMVIASPLPDEAGVTILAGLTNIKPTALAIIGFIFNTLGILILLSI